MAEPREPAGSALNRVQAIDWAAHGSDPVQVLAAFERLARVQDEADATAAYHAMLNAIAHDHSGWLYDSAAVAAPILANYVRGAGDWRRRAAIDILIECLSWARDEQQFVDTDGARHPVRQAIASSVAAVRADLELLAVHRDATAAGPAAHELLEVLSSAP